MDFLLQIMFGGLLAFVQPTDNQGMMVLAPGHVHNPVHRLTLTAAGGYNSQVLSSQGPTPAKTLQGTTAIWTIPSGYEMSILDGAGTEIPPGAVHLTRNVGVLGFSNDAEILDSRSLVNHLVDSKYLSPIGTTPSVPALLAFRARLRSGALRAHHTALREARSVELTHGTTAVTKRVIAQAMFEKNLIGAHVDLRFRNLSNNGDFFVIRLEPVVAGGIKKVFVSILNDTTPLAFCQAAPNDAGKVKHTVGAFEFLNPGIVPVAMTAFHLDTPIYDSIADECRALEEAGGFGGNKPAICYPLTAPSDRLTW